MDVRESVGVCSQNGGEREIGRERGETRRSNAKFSKDISTLPSFV